MGDQRGHPVVERSSLPVELVFFSAVPAAIDGAVGDVQFGPIVSGQDMVWYTSQDLFVAG